jgi:hypothetical protein
MTEEIKQELLLKQEANRKEDNVCKTEEISSKIEDNTSKIEDNTSKIEDNTSKIEDNPSKKKSDEHKKEKHISNHEGKISSIEEIDETVIGDKEESMTEIPINNANQMKHKTDKKEDESSKKEPIADKREEQIFKGKLFSMCTFIFQKVFSKIFKFLLSAGDQSLNKQNSHCKINEDDGTKIR